MDKKALYILATIVILAILFIFLGIFLLVSGMWASGLVILGMGALFLSAFRSGWDEKDEEQYKQQQPRNRA